MSRLPLKVGAALLAAATVIVTAPVTAASAADAPKAPCEAVVVPASGPGLTDSAVTVTGCANGLYGEDFSKLKITVNQTSGLTGKGVRITWAGGAPSIGTGTAAAVQNFLQIMQCWGDPKSANFRETCQWSGTTQPGLPPNPGRAYSNSDPQEALMPDGARLPSDAEMIPFLPGNGEPITPHGGADAKWDVSTCSTVTCREDDVLAPYFSRLTSNHVERAMTGPDGAGQVTFETQSNLEAPHMGCGAPGRLRCWLVIVPRGTHDIFGNALPGPGPDGADAADMIGPPLSASPFSNRIVVPLDFEPVGGFCPIEKEGLLTGGTELVAAAMGSWQPAVCANDGPVFSHSSYGDFAALDEISRTDERAPGMVFTAEPVPTRPGAPAVLQAPVALSSVVVAFNIDRQADPGEPGRGLEMDRLVLNPRLLAKLLTQSYQADLPGGAGVEYLKDNPRHLRRDKEFVALNPTFEKYAEVFRWDGLMVSFGDTVAAREVWRWILADPKARAWLQAEPDENKMVVNKYYLDRFKTGEPSPNLGKSDLATCKKLSETEAPPKGAEYCGLGLMPYKGSFAEAANATLRADPRKEIDWNRDAVPPKFRTTPPAEVTTRFALSITDSASAARYGLRTAELVDSSGAPVKFTDESVLKAAAAMAPTGVNGVLKNDPAHLPVGAYPLPMLTYATVNTGKPQAERQAHASLIRYAASTGQAPGTKRGELPAGYVPLPANLRQQAAATADQLAALKDPPKPTTAAGGAPADPADPAAPAAPAAAAPAATAAPVAGATPSAGALPLPAASARAVAEYTKGDPVGWMRWALFAVLLAGVGAAVAGPVILRIRARRRGLPTKTATSG